MTGMQTAVYCVLLLTYYFCELMNVIFCGKQQLPFKFSTVVITSILVALIIIIILIIPVIIIVIEPA